MDRVLDFKGVVKGEAIRVSIKSISEKILSTKKTFKSQETDLSIFKYIVRPNVLCKLKGHNSDKH